MSRASTPPGTLRCQPANSTAGGDLPAELTSHPDYEILRELGRGGMGVVYLAHNELMGRHEVLKVLGRHIISRPGVMDRFLREIRAVGQLRHPNIVAAYTAFRSGESLVFAMEYVEGLDLAKMVKARGPMPVGTCVPLRSASGAGPPTRPRAGPGTSGYQAWQPHALAQRQPGADQDPRLRAGQGRSGEPARLVESG